jgi:hypothetical protein
MANAREDLTMNRGKLSKEVSKENISGGFSRDEVLKTPCRGCGYVAEAGGS